MNLWCAKNPNKKPDNQILCIEKTFTLSSTFTLFLILTFLQFYTKQNSNRIYLNDMVVLLDTFQPTYRFQRSGYLAHNDEA